MARRTGSENDLIKCEYCGEMYSVTYKHCPFCNEDGTGRWDDLADEDGYEEYDEDDYRAAVESAWPEVGAAAAVAAAGTGGAYQSAGSSAPFSPWPSLWRRYVS